MLGTSADKTKFSHGVLRELHETGNGMIPESKPGRHRNPWAGSLSRSKVHLPPRQHGRGLSPLAGSLWDRGAGDLSRRQSAAVSNRRLQRHCRKTGRGCGAEGCLEPLPGDRTLPTFPESTTRPGGLKSAGARRFIHRRHVNEAATGTSKIMRPASRARTAPQPQSSACLRKRRRQGNCGRTAATRVLCSSRRSGSLAPAFSLKSSRFRMRSQAPQSCTVAGWLSGRLAGCRGAGALRETSSGTRQVRLRGLADGQPAQASAGGAGRKLKKVKAAKMANGLR